jgi:DNA-binding LytR/AlgR family response regulator
MATAIIADDEPRLAEDLAMRLCALWPQLEILAVAPNGIAAISVIAQHRPEFAFLDIRMPGLDGIQVAKAATHTRIVFVTAHDEYALSAFEAAAVDYLLKPVSDARLAQCVTRLQRDNRPPINPAALATLLQPAAVHLQWLTASVGETTRLIAVNEVLYLHSTEKYTEVVTTHKRHVIRLTLKELVPQLDPDSFAQIHRSFVVNLHAVERIERDLFGRLQAHLKDSSDVLPVSRGFSGRFKQM